MLNMLIADCKVESGKDIFQRYALEFYGKNGLSISSFVESPFFGSRAHEYKGLSVIWELAVLGFILRVM